MDEELVKKARGEIIHEMVEVENQMNYLIATYFCRFSTQMHSEVQFSILLDFRFTLDFKKDVVLNIISKKFDKVFVDLHLSRFLKRGETLRNFIESLIAYRNAVAHLNWFSEPTKHGYNYQLTSITMKEGNIKEKKTKLINRQDVDFFIQKACAFKSLLTDASRFLNNVNKLDQ